MNRLVTHTLKKTKTPKLEEAQYDALNVAKYLLSLDPKREYFTLN